MKKLSIVRAALAGSLLLASLGAGAIEGGGMLGAHPEAQARCQADPVKCEKMKKRAAERREACKKDPEACKQRRDEARQKMKERCQADPEKCREKMQELCQANPEKCQEIKERHARKAKPETSPVPPAEPAAGMAQ